MSQYSTEKMKAFCCNCKALTQHKYTSFGTEGKHPKNEATGFFSGLFAAILTSLMDGEATGDYKCQVCGTYLHPPDHLD
ncbi:hypothetical protein [Vibrio mediterranei]|uniref:hypothetical protein n=1 Tax=Vibrio mediterranei TaxID=689 RepID=UPI0005704669|nr:hypothetical protein [Vibrio mediterranei]